MDHRHRGGQALSRQNFLFAWRAAIAGSFARLFSSIAKIFALFGGKRPSAGEQSAAPGVECARLTAVTGNRAAAPAAAQKTVPAAPSFTSPPSPLADPAPLTSMPPETPPIPEAAPAPGPLDTTLCQDGPALAADPELEELQARVDAMTLRVLDLETRKTEMDHLLDEYALCQYRAVGDLLGEQLRLRHEACQRRAEQSSAPEDRSAADTAAEEYEAFQRARTEPGVAQITLAEDERVELKALYRSIVMRCHPDRVDEAEKLRAHEFFLRTQAAYRHADLEALRLIGKQLASPDSPAAPRAKSTPREGLEALLESLEDRGVELLLAIQTLQMEARYRQARRRDLWEDYFATVRERLENECAALRRQLSPC